MVKMNFSNKQTAFEYVIYMIAGSYFKKATCISKPQEGRLRVHYCEQKQATQFSMEEMVISFMEGTLLPLLPKDLWEEEMQVRLAVRKDSGTVEVQFLSPKYILRLDGMYKGKKSELHYRVMVKRPAAKAALKTCKASKEASCMEASSLAS